MNTNSKFRSVRRVLQQSAAATLLTLGAAQAMALGVTLCAEPYTQAVPGNAALPMWGYRQVATVAGCAAAGQAASPGPLITVPTGDTTLAITLVNKLAVPTSIVLAAQSLPSDGGPAVLAADVVGPTCVPSPAAASTAAAHPQNCRVRSFTGETDPGGSRTYTFSNLRPGTYLYQSGTHPQVQIQMGLFGMARQDATVTGSTGRQLFVGPNAGFDVDVPVVLSEIDPDQHIRIAGTLGSADPTTWKSGNNSTLNYTPKFFLINGKMFDAAAPSANDLVVTNAGSGSRVVLRIANAGLTSRSLVLNSGTWQLLTEDGYPYPAAREQASALVPAGKTTDALLISTAPGDNTVSTSVAIFDRRGGTDNGGGALGGQVARLAQSGPPVPYIAAIGNQVANEGSTFSLQLAGVNITNYALSGPAGMTVSPTGLISWPVPTGTAVPTNAAVTVTGTGNLPPPSVRSFTVRVNHAPTIAQTGPFAVAHGSVTVPAAGVLAGATDPDGDSPLTAVQAVAVSSGSLSLAPNGSFTWTGPQPATGSTAVTFAARAQDAFGLASTPKTVTLNVAANVPPVAAGDAFTLTLARVPLINTLRSVNDALQIAAMTSPVGILTANDTDPDGGSIDAATIARVVPVPPLAGTISARRINPASPAGCTSNCATIAIPLLGSQASVTFNPNGTFVLRPHATLLTIPVLGTYEFRYTVRDEQNGLSNQAIVRVTVN